MDRLKSQNFNASNILLNAKVFKSNFRFKTYNIRIYFFTPYKHTFVVRCSTRELVLILSKFLEYKEKKNTLQLKQNIYHFFKSTSFYVSTANFIVFFIHECWRYGEYLKMPKIYILSFSVKKILNKLMLISWIYLHYQFFY